MSSIGAWNDPRGGPGASRAGGSRRQQVQLVEQIRHRDSDVRFWGIAEVGQRPATASHDANDPNRSSMRSAFAYSGFTELSGGIVRITPA